MYRKELFLFGSLIVGVFAIVAIASALLMRKLQYEGQWLVVDTLPGLVNAGEAMSRMNDNWLNIRLLTEASPESRSNLLAEIHANNTENLWQQYRNSVFDSEDRALFDNCQSSRSNYLALLQHYFVLVGTEKLELARKYRFDSLEPAYRLYKEDAKKLFHLNTTISGQRAARIVRLNHWLPFTAGLFSVIVFGLGLLFGVRGAFTGLDLVFCRKPVKTAQNQEQPAEKI
jgi:hypothetical protein